jgi:hypothetical protein
MIKAEGTKRWVGVTSYLTKLAVGRRVWEALIENDDKGM